MARRSSPRYILLSRDPAIAATAREALGAEIAVLDRWQDALEAAAEAKVLIVDLIATLNPPHKIQGYEEFALAKMQHPTARGVPIVLISPPDDYELNAMIGWPDFLAANVRRPITRDLFRRVANWV